MAQATEGSLRQSIETIEEAYEFMLAYAAQGLSEAETRGPASEIRSVLERTGEALEGLSAHVAGIIEKKQAPGRSKAAYREFVHVLERDATATLAAIRLVLAQSSISSQLVDNLNAWIHLRALLTDLFLIDEILKAQ